jgi:hypothetical protein
MSIATLILGTPGTGKSTSLRNMDPTKTLLIQCVKKPLPFRTKSWGYLDKANPKGNIILADSGPRICELMRKTSRKVICLDDSNYVMSNAFMRRASETGYQKFTEMAQDTFAIFETAANLAEDVRVYIFAHTQQTEDGITRFKTVGKLLDEKVSLDGLVTICLRTVVHDGQFYFATRNSGADTVKTPMLLFADDLISNDLQAVDEAICGYYEIGKST